MSSSSSIFSANTVHLRITMPDFPDVQMVMPFSTEDTVYNVKQKFLQNLKRELPDGQNYGLFIPPASCRSGKFLEEERCLSEYPLTGGIKYFEFKYKNRFKFSHDVSTLKLKKLNTQPNQREFLEMVRRDDSNRISKVLNKGFNPNFNHILQGETPLTLATTLKRPRTMLILLVSGGAHLDYRSRYGDTPLHAAVHNDNKDALRTLLDLGSSPNYKNADSLTPLFVCCRDNDSLQLTSMLLHERAQLQCRDRHGCTELHHACMKGKKDLVEQLIYYGSDLHSSNHNGDTPLHLCAAHSQVTCCKELLMRGADKTLTNNKGQTPLDICHIYFQNAKINGNMNEGTEQCYRLLKDFDTAEIVYFNEPPVYNQKRRGLITAATIRSLEKSRSNPNLHLLFANQLNPTSTVSAASLNFVVKNHLKQLSNDSNSSSMYRNSDIGSTEQVGNGNLHSIRARPEGRLSAMELNWSAVEKKSVNNGDTIKEFPNGKFDEKALVIRKPAGKGFGFSIKNTNELSEQQPCRQQFNEVYEAKAAWQAGLRTGDFLAKLNDKDVREISHDECVHLLKVAGNEIRVLVLRKRTEENNTDSRFSGKKEKKEFENSYKPIAQTDLYANANEINGNTKSASHNVTANNQKDNAVKEIQIDDISKENKIDDVYQNQDEKRKKYRLRLCVDTTALRSWIVH